MQCKYFVFGILAIVVVTETRLLRPSIEAPSRRGSWKRKTSLSIFVPQPPGRARSAGKPSLSHSISLNNLNLKPGQTKVITQRIVVRQHPNGNHAQAQSQYHKRRGVGGRGGKGRGGRGRGGSGRVNSRTQSPIGSAYPQRGANPTRSPHGSGPGHNNLFLLSRMPPGSRLNQALSNGHNGFANLHLPVIDLSRASPTNSLGGAIGGGGHSPGNHQNGAPGIGASVYDQHSIHNTGIHASGAATALLVPEVIVVQGPINSPSNSGHNMNNFKQLNIAGGHAPSAFNSKMAPSTVLKHVQTTMEPGEDPPEVP